MKVLLVFIFLVFTITIKADQPRHQTSFASKNDNFELKLKDLEKAEWTLINKETNTEIYKLNGAFWSMSVFVSNDGKSIIAVDDYSEQEAKENPDVVSFYYSGKKTKSYKLFDLMTSPKFVSFSASHFSWLYNYQPSYEPFYVENSKINLQTYELNNFSFDIETGELSKKEKDEVLSGNAIYVSGFLNNIGNDKYQMTVQCVIYGKIPQNKKIIFESVKYRWIGGSGNETLVIKDGRLIEKKGVIFNNCR